MNNINWCIKDQLFVFVEDMFGVVEGVVWYIVLMIFIVYCFFSVSKYLFKIEKRKDWEENI